MLGERNTNFNDEAQAKPVAAACDQLCGIRVWQSATPKLGTDREDRVNFSVVFWDGDAAWRFKDDGRLWLDGVALAACRKMG